MSQPYDRPINWTFNHFSQLDIFYYLGKVVSNYKIYCLIKNYWRGTFHSIGTGNLLLIPLLELLISSLVCKASKYFANPTMILQYQTSVSESTANRRISFFSILVIYLNYIGAVVGSIARSVIKFHTIINLDLITVLLTPRWMFRASELPV